MTNDITTIKATGSRGRKVQTQLLVLPEVLDRLNALAAASGYVRAEVTRSMVDERLSAWEKRNAAGLERLKNAADRFEVDLYVLARHMNDDKLTLADVEKLEAYPRPFGA